jgi:hypothetical protein
MMNRKSVLVLASFIVLAGGFEAATTQFPIKIPKIKAEKPKVEQPKTESTRPEAETKRLNY